jgi:hypothetical protein
VPLNRRARIFRFGLKNGVFAFPAHTPCAAAVNVTGQVEAWKAE